MQTRPKALLAWQGAWLESPPTSLSPPAVFTVLLHLKNELNRGDFFMTLRNQPMALSLYRQVSAVGEGLLRTMTLSYQLTFHPSCQFCKHQELETLKDLYNQDDNHQELGSFHIRASYAAEEV